MPDRKAVLCGGCERELFVGVEAVYCTDPQGRHLAKPRCRECHENNVRVDSKEVIQRPAKSFRATKNDLYF